MEYNGLELVMKNKYPDEIVGRAILTGLADSAYMAKYKITIIDTFNSGTIEECAMTNAKICHLYNEFKYTTKGGIYTKQFIDYKKFMKQEFHYDFDREYAKFPIYKLK